MRRLDSKRQFSVPWNERINEWAVAVAYPRSGSSSTVSTSNWNLEMLVFVEEGKLENQARTPEQGRETATNSTHIWRQLRDSSAAQILVTGHCRRVVSLDKKLYSTLSLFTQVYKWVPAIIMLEGNLAMG